MGRRTIILTAMLLLSMLPAANATVTPTGGTTTPLTTTLTTPAPPASETTDAQASVYTSLQQVFTDIVQTKARMKHSLEAVHAATKALPGLKGKLHQARNQRNKLQARQRIWHHRFVVERAKLNRMTAAYIHAAQQISSSGGGRSSDQQLSQYLSTGTINDAVLVYQTARSLLQDQSEQLDKVRRQAIKLSATEMHYNKIIQDGQGKVIKALGAVRTNEATQLANRRSIASDTQHLQSLKAELAWQRMVWTSTTGSQTSVLQPGQTQFAYQLASVTGLDINIIQAWLLAEESGSYAAGRQEEGNFNWLNIGYFDSLAGGGAFQKQYSIWGNPVEAANASAAFLQGDFLGASEGIQAILNSAGKSRAAQIHALSTSGWASSGYGGGESLRGTLKLVTPLPQPAPLTIRWRNPKTHKTITIGPKNAQR